MPGEPHTNAGGASRIDYPANPRLQRMRALSRFLDNSILLPGGYRIGADPLIGLIPAAGDLIAAGLSFWLIYDAALLGLPGRVLGKMLGNVVVEMIVGSIPGLGDLFDAAWKANARNMRLVDLYYSPTLKPRSERAIFGMMAGIGGLLFLLWIGAVFLSFSLFFALLNAVSGQ